MEDSMDDLLYRYDEAKRLLKAIIKNFLILSGDQVGPSGKTWRDLALKTATDLYLLGDQLNCARSGYVVGGPIVFPSPGDLGEER